MSREIKLRPYQQEAVDTLAQSFRRRKKGILVLPTGGGKTITSWSFLKENFLDKNKKVLWVVHRHYLIDQAISALKKISPDTSYSIWDADTKDKSGQVVLAMVMSTKKLKGHFDILVIDEAHRAGAPSYENLEKRITATKKLGLTATPGRLDNKTLRLGDILYQISFRELVSQGWLSKPNMQVITTGEKHTVTISNGDLTNASLRLYNTKDRNDLIIKSIKDNPDWGKTLVFCIDIEHIEALSSQVPNSAIVHSKLSPKEREEELRKFADNEVQYLFNCEVFTEGYDLPDVQTIIVARPTTSRGLWQQMVGRGARITDTKKEFNLVVLLDDLGKYEYLVQEWALDNIENYTSPAAEKSSKINSALKYLGEDNQINDLKLINNVNAILRVASAYANVPYKFLLLDKSRLICLYILAKYMQGVVKPAYEQDNPKYKDYIDVSYGFCVTGGEFTIQEWRMIAWAFFSSKIQQIEFNQDNKEFWQVIYIDKITIDKVQVSKLIQESKQKISDFNALSKQLFGEERLAPIKDFHKEVCITYPKLKYMKTYFKSLKISSRVAILETSLSNGHGPITHYIRQLSKVISEKMDDDNIPVILRINR